MSLLVRKIARAKWGKDGGVDSVSSADAITGCLKTASNELSVWIIHDAREIEDAILALVSVSDTCDAIDIVTISEDRLVTPGLKIKISSGKTPYVAFKDRHRDIYELDYHSLGSIAALVRDAITTGHYERVLRKRLKQILRSGIETGKIEEDGLNAKLRSEISE
ncbi:MAG: hypothetical protein Q7J31_05910 [Syntrophales bacterium]|nr:hypothetical protein [Syntrophales bacterium]